MNQPALQIATIGFPEFYADTVGSRDAARALYESLSGTDSEALRTAKIILHQAARMVWLADRIDAVSRGRPALQVMFYMIAAEAVANLLLDMIATTNRGRTFYCSSPDSSAANSARRCTGRLSGQHRGLLIQQTNWLITSMG